MFDRSENAPGGWQVRRLDELAANITSGGTPTAGDSRYYTFEGGLPFAKTEDLSRAVSKFLENCELQITQAALRDFSAKPYPAGTILISMYGTIGLTKITASEMAANQALCALLAPFDCNIDFLYHQLAFIRPKWTLFSGQTTQANISGSIVREADILVPPHDEQSIIASILDTLDTQIQKTEALIDKLEKVKEGLLHDLLTRGIDESGRLRPSPEQAPELYKESPLGPIPRAWEVRPLKFRASSEITYGIVQAGPHIEGGVPYIRTGDMSGDRLVRKGLLCTSQQVADQYKRSEVMGGDLVISIRATVGKVLPVPESLSGANLTQGTAKISPSSGTDRDYLLWAIRSEAVKNAIDLEVKGSTFKEITLAALREIPVAAPANLIEQRKIGESLADIDGVIRRESDALMKLKAHKIGLMDDLLTGRVRVTPLLDQAQATTPA